MYYNFSTPSSNLFNRVEQNPLSITKRTDIKKSITNSNSKLSYMKNLTQEILESEYEPINKTPFSKEEQANDESEDEKSTLDDKDISISTDSVTVHLTTSLKNKDIFKIPQTNEQIFNGTPKTLELHKDHLSTCIEPDIKKIVINDVTYRVLKQLGKGGSAVVYYCLDTKNNHERAVKVVNLKTDMNTVMGYHNEVKLLRQLNNCDHIIKMYDYKYLKLEQKLMVFLEKGGPDLAKLVKNLKMNGKKLPIHKVVFFWMEMLYAVQEIHKNGIVHADLKPANFLQVDCGLKLIDFGIAAQIQDGATSVVRNNVIGSFNYISPEALTNNSSGHADSSNCGIPKYKINCKSDVWSLGCILYELLYDKTPFGYIQHIPAKLCVIMDPHHKIEYPTYEWIPRKLIDTIKSCLQYETRNRVSVDDLIREYENTYC